MCTLCCCIPAQTGGKVDHENHRIIAEKPFKSVFVGEPYSENFVFAMLIIIIVKVGVGDKQSNHLCRPFLIAPLTRALSVIREHILG